MTWRCGTNALAATARRPLAEQTAMRRNAILPRFIAEPILREPMARCLANSTSYKPDHETSCGGRLEFDEKRDQPNHEDAKMQRCILTEF
jgi:hypothetical protein